MMPVTKHLPTNTYLLVFAQEHFNFRIQELDSVLALIGFSLNDHVFKIDDISETEKSPFIFLNGLSEKEVCDVLNRTVLVKNAYELWGYGKDYTNLKQSIIKYPIENKSKYFSKEKSFCIRVKGFGRKVSTKEQVKKIDSLEDTLLFEGDVNLNNPSEEYHLIEDYGFNYKTGRANEELSYVYFGRWIGSGQRKLEDKYTIKKRKFIGNTSMDAVLSLIMSNVAGVKPGDLVCDPFVGTGSLLVSAAHFGAWVIGGDINYNVIHGRGKTSRAGGGWRDKDESIRHSLEQYGLTKHYVDAIIHDAANDPWKKKTELFDAIIADPPYGVREKSRKVGSNEKKYEDSNTQHPIHYPEKSSYILGDVFCDLINFAYRTLLPHGRLVYWLPVYRPEYNEEMVPSHPGFKILYNCEQCLNHKTSRRLIVMEKILSNQNHKFSAEIKNNVFEEHNSFRNKYLKISSDML